MKNKFLCALILTCSFLSGQVNYPKFNIELISHLTPNFGVGSIDGRLYAGCWGWKQYSKNKEYAISGASNGTYFIDVSNPSTPSVCAYVAGRLASTWREMKTYQNYCYIVCDDQAPNRFQIVDMQYLPDSVHIIHDGTDYFERGHTIFIDGDKMYIGSASSTTGFSAMNIYSLATPTAPVLLRKLADDIPNIIPVVHDMYVRNDTIYASCGDQGLFIIKYDPVANTFTQLGSFSGYTSAGYNHSSWLTQDGKHLIFCDEVPAGKPIHFVNVENFNNIQPVQTFKPYPGTTPHNPYIIGNDFALVSCYQDGLIIYDISEPGNAAISGYFDTHPQGGASAGDQYFGADYRGNWGAYPYLPSGIIIAQDMQNGVFILDGTAAFSNRVGIKNATVDQHGFAFYPNPAVDELFIKFEGSTTSHLSIQNMLGQIIYQTHLEPGVKQTIDLKSLESGSYIISHTMAPHTTNKKLIITH